MCRRIAALSLGVLAVSSTDHAASRHEARRRAHAARSRLRCPHLRGQFRGADRGPRARGQRRRRALDRPLRDRRAADLGMRDPDLVAVRPRAAGVAPADVRRARHPYAVHDRAAGSAVDVLDVRLPHPVRPARRPGVISVRDGDGFRSDRAGSARIGWRSAELAGRSAARIGSGRSAGADRLASSADAELGGLRRFGLWRPIAARSARR